MYFALSNVFGYFSTVTKIITFIGTLGIFLICLRRPAGKTIAVLALTALVNRIAFSAGKYAPDPFGAALFGHEVSRSANRRHHHFRRFLRHSNSRICQHDYSSQWFPAGENNRL
jgi:hypothetical protein